MAGISLPVPTRRLALGALVVVAAELVIPTPVLGFYVLNAILLLVAIVDCVLAPAPDRVGVERDLPRVIPLGGEGTVTWRVTNPLDRPARIAVADELAPSLHAGRRRLSLVVPRRGTVTQSTVLRPSRRGRFEPTEVVVRTTGPCELLARQRRRQLPGTLRVYPPFKSRDEAELRLDRARIVEVGLRSARGRAAARSSSRCGSSRPTTSSASSTGPPPPGRASPSSAPTGPSGTSPSSSSSTTAGSWPAGSTVSPASSTPWTP